MPSTSTKKEMAISDVLYALSIMCDGAMMRMKVLHDEPPRVSWRVFYL